MRLRADRQVRARPCEVQVSERRVPADTVNRVRAVGAGPEPQRARRLDRGRVPRRRFVGDCRPALKLCLCAVEVRREFLARPPVAPLVVVGVGAAEHQARVVSRAAADDLGPCRPALVNGRVPVVCRGNVPRVEHLGRPAVGAERPVVGPGLDEADAPTRILAQARREHAARGAAAEHEHVVSLHRRSSQRRASSADRSRTNRGSPANLRGHCRLCRTHDRKA